ncbi:MAG: EAL domain-containing protein [Rubrivivax sp.]|nr:EAL domain-containing protein [Rubrivivax sp.]
MKLDGVFLDSRLGRRIFVLFILAATVPIALLGALAYGGWSSHTAAQDDDRLTKATRYVALTVLDRLLVARMALQFVVPDASGRALDPRLRGMFVSVAGEDGPDLPSGIAQPPAVPARQAEPPAADRGLFWMHPAGEGSAPIVMLRVRDAATGQTTIGELDPRYLWSEIADDAGGEEVCVFSTTGARIFCSSAAGTVAESSPPAATASASWSLFLRHEFGVDDWRFTLQRPVDSATRAGFSLVNVAWQVVLASILLVTVLSLVLVRRTTVPLHKLTAGTRRLAGGDYGVRVDVHTTDEFGELGAAFNDMAGRIGQQVHQLEVLSSIDRAILEASDAARLVPRALARLADLSPGTPVGIALIDPALPAHLDCTLQDAAGDACERRLGMNPELQMAMLEQNSAWRRSADIPALAPLLAALGWPQDEVYVAPARRREQTLGVLLVGGGMTPAFDAAWERQLGELRDRIAVALASADRERQLLHRATHDSLTGLLNRAGLHDALEQAVRAQLPFALMLIDLDRFKEINDTMGHEAGDELLCVMAQTIAGSLPPGAILARLGGDEFVALVPEAASGPCDEVADELVAHVGHHVMLRGTQVTAGASLGVARYPADGDTAADLLRHADLAMYAAKARGGAQVARFEAALDSAALEHAVLSRDLARAVDGGELRLHYQPRVDAQTGIAQSVEALVRWQHPTRGLMMPGAFIDLAEATGLIGDIGHWVLHEACRQMAVWRREHVALKKVAVNLSVHQLRSPAIVDDVFRALRSHGLVPADLELEVTESVLIGDVKATSRLLAQLRNAGIRVAIDDFGTGYSSMAYLRYLPVDVLKIDRAFVKDIGSDASADIVVRAIVGLAGSLGLSTVAEGVETAAQAQLLKEMGCGELQGYHYARPLPPQEVPRAACVCSTVVSDAAGREAAQEARGAPAAVASQSRTPALPSLVS